MKLLIDSSTNYLYLAVVNNEKISTFIRSGKNDHSETLVDYLNTFLKENNYIVDDIKEVYIGRGPGSYTGLRIAGTVGKVFAFINHKKLYSFSSLDLIIAKVIEQNGNYIARIDAKKNHSYYKIVKINDSKIEIINDEEFGENTLLESYNNYQVLEMNDEFFEEKNKLAYNILKYQLFKEEDVFDYTPNYIRSGI